MNNLPETVARMKTEILADIAAGTVPASVFTFSELHDYVDANEYGGFCDAGSVMETILALQEERDSLTEEQERNWSKAGELEELQEQSTAFANAAQNAVDKWLKTGGHHRPAFDPSGLPASVAGLASEKAARSWCYVTPDGRTFYLDDEDKARKIQAMHNGKIFPPL